MRAVLGFLPSLTALAPAFFSWVRCSARISQGVESLFHSPRRASLALLIDSGSWFMAARALKWSPFTVSDSL